MCQWTVVGELTVSSGPVRLSRHLSPLALGHQHPCWRAALRPGPSREPRQGGCRSLPWAVGGRRSLLHGSGWCRAPQPGPRTVSTSVSTVPGLGLSSGWDPTSSTLPQPRGCRALCDAYTGAGVICDCFPLRYMDFTCRVKGAENHIFEREEAQNSTKEQISCLWVPCAGGGWQVPLWAQSQVGPIEGTPGEADPAGPEQGALSRRIGSIRKGPRSSLLPGLPDR